MGTPRPQHEWKIDASFERQIGPCTVPGKTEREDVSRLCPHAPPWRNARSRERRIKIGAGEGEHNVRAEAKAERKCLDLYARCIGVVAQKSVSGSQRDRIHD